MTSVPPKCFEPGAFVALLSEFSGSLEGLLDLLQYSWTGWGKSNNYDMLHLMDWSLRKFSIKRLVIKIV